MQRDLETEVLCGQLIVGGFDGAEPPARYLRALAEGRRGGAILFRRNVPDVDATARLCQALAAAGGPERPPFIGIDQEGGRVTRLRAPFLALPPMRSLGELMDIPLLRRAARAVASELRAVGINLNFAPVLDVDSNPENPIIGDRAFGRDPHTVTRAAVAFLEGLQEEGVLACGKHFPGHGDTALDSHLALPTIAHGRGRLDEIELPPFRAASRAGVASLMTAHIVVEALDPGVPATLSRAICTGLLRDEIGFEGVLFSDDLEMAAIAAHYPVEEAATAAIWAGCDALLVCKDEDLQDRAHEALVRRAERDPRFRERCVEAAARGLEQRRLRPPRPAASPAELAEVVGGPASRAVLEDIERARAALAAGAAT
ncbi:MULTISPECIES: beta-N-acetylhexosaminidase [Sorangium]|uniref:beta-N-acetylhexosaminidase n=1 Tax=Sorangium TaxID=39643 RepID=UPI003D9C08E2